MEIYERLIAVRNQFNESQAQFSQRLGLAQSTYANYEKGIRSIPDDLKIKLTQFGINLTWLIAGIGEMYLEESSGHDITSDDFSDAIRFKKEFSNVYELWEKSKSEHVSGGCALCDTVHQLNTERTIKLKGYAEVLVHEQIAEDNHKENTNAG